MKRASPWRELMIEYETYNGKQDLTKILLISQIGSRRNHGLSLELRVWHLSHLHASIQPSDIRLFFIVEDTINALNAIKCIQITPISWVPVACITRKRKAYIRINSLDDSPAKERRNIFGFVHCGLAAIKIEAHRRVFSTFGKDGIERGRREKQSQTDEQYILNMQY